MTRGITKSLVGVSLVAAGALGVATLAGHRKPYSTEKLTAPADEPDIRFVTTGDGATLRVCVYGPADGLPIVFSHGWTERAEYWLPQINALSGEYRLITYDQRGHGESTTGTRDFASDVLADDFADVLEATLDPQERAVLAGHSMGGMTLMAWAARHPEQALHAGGILLHNTGYDQLIKATRLLPLLPAGRIPHALGTWLLATPIPWPPVSLLRPLIKWRIMPGGNREQVDFCARLFVTCPPQVRARWARVLAELALDGPAPIEGVPTTVLVGEKDYLSPPVHAHRIAEALQAAGNPTRLVIVPDIGHEANIEAADRYNAELRHLADLARGTEAKARDVS